MCEYIIEMKNYVTGERMFQQSVFINPRVSML